jgi:Fibrobacter succinogenes major domain (Fib_succ_major).
MKQANKVLLVILAVGMIFSFGCNKSSDPVTQGPGGNTGATTVTIGTQVWTAVNLNVETYRNGNLIPQVQDSAQWANLTTGAWCYYNNAPAIGNTYGKLYNWYAVNDSRGLAPAGWHIPSDTEWTTLTNYLGGESVAGGKLKDTTLWQSPNTGATNSSGFTAFPGGDRLGSGDYGDIGKYGSFWSASGPSVYNAWYRTLSCGSSDVFRTTNDKKDGFSIRCVRD